jgi:hypothetical protein
MDWNYAVRGLAFDTPNSHVLDAWESRSLVAEYTSRGRPRGTDRWGSRESCLRGLGDIAREIYFTRKRRPTIELVAEYITPHDDWDERPVDPAQIRRWINRWGWNTWDEFLREAIPELMSP